MTSIEALEGIVVKLAAENEKRAADDAKRAAENDAFIAKMRAENDAIIAKMQAEREEANKSMKALESTVGGWGTRLGMVMEMAVIPGIRPLLKKHGHEYERIVSNKTIKNARGCVVAEVDVLLDNGVEAMAVEIKTCPSTGMVDRHIARLNYIRANEERVGVKGKELYGAMAAIIIEPHVQRYALDKGLYFIEIIEDEDRLEILAPETIGRF